MLVRLTLNTMPKQPKISLITSASGPTLTSIVSMHNYVGGVTTELEEYKFWNRLQYRTTDRTTKCRMSSSFSSHCLSESIRVREVVKSLQNMSVSRKNRELNPIPLIAVRADD